MRAFAINPGSTSTKVALFDGEKCVFSKTVRHSSEELAQFSTLETLDRKAVVQLIQSITIIGKKELAIKFNYDNEYNKALAMVAETELRKAG